MDPYANSAQYSAVTCIFKENGVGSILLLYLFVFSLLSAPFAVLFEFNFALDELAVFA
jgi:hypothetical protein